MTTCLQLKDYQPEEEPEGGGGSGSGGAGSSGKDGDPTRDLESGLSVAELSQLTAPRGEYQLRVHVVEARGLVGRDAGGTCDPQVQVSVFGQTRRTSQKSKETNPVWDENIFIVGKDVDQQTLAADVVKLEVTDVEGGSGRCQGLGAGGAAEFLRIQSQAMLAPLCE